jgi:hypothetical protein
MSPVDEVILVFFVGGALGLLRRGDPEGVGVEEEEENHAESHEVHVDEKQDATVVEAPASLHAADGVRSAGGSEEGGEDEERSGVDLGEVGEEDCGGQAGQDKEAAAKEGSLARIERAGEHTILNQLELILCSLDF